MYEHTLAEHLGLTREALREYREQIPGPGNWSHDPGKGIHWTASGLAALDALLFAKKTRGAPPVPPPPPPASSALEASLEGLAAKKPPPVKIRVKATTANNGILLGEIAKGTPLVRIRVNQAWSVELNGHLWCRLVRDPDLYEVHPDAKVLGAAERKAAALERKAKGAPHVD